MSNNQKSVFLQSEGNSWYRRNKKAIGEKDDVVQSLITKTNINVDTVLEIGCSNGWRLNNLKKKYNNECFGIEPSLEAVEEGCQYFPEITIMQSTADVIPIDKQFDLIIYGFCLYLCDRSDLFKIIYEGDKHLKENGHIIILDFDTPIPYKKNYCHYEGIYSYKMDYSKLFLSNPSYFLIDKHVFTHNQSSNINDYDERVSVTLIKKNIENAYISR